MDCFGQHLQCCNASGPRFGPCNSLFYNYLTPGIQQCCLCICFYCTLLQHLCGELCRWLGWLLAGPEPVGFWLFVAPVGLAMPKVLQAVKSIPWMDSHAVPVYRPEDPHHFALRKGAKENQLKLAVP